MITKNLKFVEIRDRGTCIPALAILLDGSFSDAENRILSRAGYGNSFDMHYVYLIHLESGVGHYDPYKWGINPRTMREAHKYILENYDSINSSQVIDVEYILGESDKPKVSDIQSTSCKFEKIIDHQSMF